MAQTDPQAAGSGSATSLDRVGRLNPSENLVGDPGGVSVSAIGVELLPLGFAPFGEIVRVNVNADHAHAFCLKTFAANFGCRQPLIVGPMEFVAVLEHGSKPVEVLTLEPHHAGGLNRLGHMGAPLVGNAAIVATEGGAA